MKIESIDVDAAINNVKQLLEDDPNLSPAFKSAMEALIKARNLLERLRDYESDVLRFMDNPMVPFTNNQKHEGKIKSFVFFALRGEIAICSVHYSLESKVIA